MRPEKNILNRYAFRRTPLKYYNVFRHNKKRMRVKIRETSDTDNTRFSISAILTNVYFNFDGNNVMNCKFIYIQMNLQQATVAVASVVHKANRLEIEREAQPTNEQTNQQKKKRNENNNKKKNKTK